MNAHLLGASNDFPWEREPFWNEATLVQDLELETLYRAMAAGDEFVYGVAKQVLPVSLVDLDDILYRQAVLADCVEHEEVVRALYDLAAEAIELERKNFYWGFSGSASSVLHDARNIVQAYLGALEKLRRVADSQSGKFQSVGFRRFFSIIREALTDDYFVTIAHCLKALKFNDGVLVSAQPGRGNQGKHYVLRKPHEKEPNLVKRWLAPRPPSRTFRIADRDENGARALSDLEARGINHVANALAQSADHIKRFFLMLRAELAFYLGCVNLRGELVRREIPVCMPVPHVAGERRHWVVQLHDASLALRMDRPPVANDVDANGRDLIVVTGANQGGKSTFLRSLGIAQVLLQAGAFVAADAFEANLASMIVTHYKREEEATMHGGKFDEELRRMSDAVDHLAEHAIFLSNESFASTNEREGSDIGRQIIDALLEGRIKIVLVTHLFTLAKGLYDDETAPATFLRAERREDGTRSFRLTEGEPLQTSFGQDLYHQIFVDPSTTVEEGAALPKTHSNA